MHQTYARLRTVGAVYTAYGAERRLLYRIQTQWNDRLL